MIESTSLQLKAIRAARGWSQAQMAEYLGCDQATVSRIENGAKVTGPIRRLVETLSAQAAA